jgi:hypothetical protein
MLILDLNFRATMKASSFEIAEINNRNHSRICSNSTKSKQLVIAPSNSAHQDEPESYSYAHHHPTQSTICTHAEFQIGLNHQEHNCGPEHDLQGVENHACFQTMPFSESGGSFGYDLIEGDDE